ncbi:AsnC family transcriptional regulator [Rhodococcus sp. NPDC056516]|uniref:AsnC family transcriptional regulator n=1 Tax=Rhodococcus sp. NPDC056516 TaxID=3345847 RepID=UPI00366C192E
MATDPRGALAARHLVDRRSIVHPDANRHPNFVEGGDWQLRSLDIGEQGLIKRNRPRAHDVPGLVSDRSFRELLGILAEDARMGVSELADGLGVSRPTARRRIEGALARREIVVRCDVPLGLTRWPVSAALWADVPPEQHADVARTLIRPSRDSTDRRSDRGRR